MRLSVIICTHNPRREYFARCIAALRAQTLSPSHWELVVVDNASNPPVSAHDGLDWHPHLRAIREDRLGLTPARLRAIRESQGELLVFVDDDNVLDPDYLETALRVASERTYLGSWSGQCRPEFEAPPPEWTRPYWGNLVIREFDSDVWSNLPRLAATMPCGAGLCARREVASRYLHLHTSGQRTTQFDRRGDSLLSGGDNDLAACACDIGLGLGLIASLRLTHHIPAARLTEDYLTRLTEGIYFSSTLLDAERGSGAIVPRSAIGRLADAVRVLRARGPHRRILRAAFRGHRRAIDVLMQNQSYSQS